MKHPFMFTSSKLTNLLILSSSLFFIIACGKDKIKDPNKEILSVKFLKSDSTVFNEADVSVFLEKDSILVYLPPNADLSRIKPVITYKGEKISPLSGVTMNFTNPVVFNVTAEDGSSRSYVAVVKAQEVNKVYVGDTGGRLVCYDAKTGVERWIKTIPGGEGFGYSQACLKNNTIYIGGTDAKVYAINSMTGEVKWTYQALQAIESSPIVENGLVYIGSNHLLFAIDAETGKLRWTYTTYGNVSGKALYDNGIIYIAADGTVYALNASTGSWIRAYYTNQSETLYYSGETVLYKGHLFIGSRYGKLYAFNKETGNLKWTFNDDRASMEQSTPIIRNDTIFISSSFEMGSSPTRFGSTYAIDANTGTLIWKSQNGIGFKKNPVYHDGILYMSGYDDKFKALNSKDGSAVWQVANFRGMEPTLGNNLLFVGEGLNKRFCAIEPKTGRIVWEKTGGHFIFNKPLVVDNRGRVIN